MRASEEEEFRDYVHARTPALIRTAYLLCGDWHRAEDGVAAAVVKLYASWRRARRADHLDAYVRRIVVNTVLDERRRGWRREHATGTVPEQTGGHEDADPDRRADLRRLLDQLPPRHRAVLVLRYYDDLSIEQTAEALDTTPGAVKSLTLRALNAIRGLLPAGVTTRTELEDAR